MTLTKALIDTNVCLDAALTRKPFNSNALKIIEYSQYEKFSGIIAAHSLNTLFYIINNENNKEATYTVLDSLRRAFRVAPVTQKIIDTALKLKWNDFEDAIHYAAAQAANCDAIITRNKKDFKDADLPVLSPLEFLDYLEDSEEE